MTAHVMIIGRQAGLLPEGLPDWFLQKDANGDDVPLKGVIIEVVGDEERTRATTDENGTFTLSPVPAGRFFVNVDGRQVTGGFPDAGYYPFVGKAWKAVAGRMDNPASGTGLHRREGVAPAELARGTGAGSVWRMVR